LNSELPATQASQPAAADAGGKSGTPGTPGGAAETRIAAVPPGKLDKAPAAVGAASGVRSASDSSTAAARKAVEAITAAGTPGNTGYKIGAQDVIEISVFKVPELSKMVQVSETGTVNLPLIGEVSAAGRTATELEKALTASLGAKYLQNPQVTVYVKEYNSQRVTLEGGGVKKPGVYPLRGRMTLLQLIATAEGLSELSSSEVAVFREENGKRMGARFDVSAIRSGEVADPPLRAGDVIVAPTSMAKETLNSVIKLVPLAAVFALL